MSSLKRVRETPQLKLAEEIMQDGLKHHFDEECVSLPESFDVTGMSFDGLYAIEQDLDDLLARAQNAPPEGKADGTIDAPRWRILKHTHDAIRALRHSLDAWERLK